MRELVSDDAPVELVPFSELGPGRTDLFREAVARLAVAWERPAPTTPPPPLDDPLYGRVLYLHMAALAWLDGVSVAANELLAGVLDHEERFWFEQAALRSLNDRERRLLRARIRRSIMALTLLGGVAGRDQAAALLHRLDGQTDEVVLLLLHDLYSGRCLSSGRLAFIGALEPDLLGEAMVRRALLGEGDGARDVLDRVFAGADERAVRVGLEVLGRLSIEHADEARQWIGDVIAVNVGGRAVAALEAAKSVGELTAHSALGLQLALALELRGDLPLAFRLEEAGIPDVTVSLREVAAWVLSTKVNALSGAKDPWSRATRAQMLNDLGVRQQALGRHREASASMQKAERLFRDLSKTHPEHRQRLALTLRNRVGTQIHAGAHDAALRSAKEAVEIYRGLVAARPEEHQEELAAGLNNLALAQGELGQLWAALDSMKEASDIYRALSAQASERDLRPVLAQLLSNLGKAQSELGEQEAALSSTREAVTLRRALVVIQPDAFLPDLVQGLINLGKMLLALGRSEEARESTREAIANLRRLAGARPDVFLQNLALSLNNLGQMERALGRDEAACEPIEEAVIIYRRLARERPSVALAELGMCLTNLGHVHYTFGRWELATAAATESVECYRAANKEHPSIHRAALALSLNNLSHMRSAVGDHHGALASAEEAMAHYAALDAAEPGAFRPALGLSLTSVAKARRLTGDVQGSLEPARAAVANYTAHVEAYPGTFQSELALSLNTLGNVQSTIGEHADAVRSIEAALDLMRPLFEQRPEAIERQLVGTLQDLNSALIALERWHEALPTTQESISRSRALARRWPGESALNLATSLRDYSLVLQRLDRPQEGLIALQEALEMISPFVKKESERFGPIASRLTESLRLCRLALGPSGGSSEG
ncbi:MAG: tetratricopeptide repeat protein [Byssovorax sp.]